MSRRHRLAVTGFLACAWISGGLAAAQGIASADLYRLRSVGDVQLSPDGTRIAYSVQNSDRPGSPYSQIWIRDLKSGETRRLGDDREAARTPRWSPDGRWVAFHRRQGDQGSLMVARGG